MPPKRNKHDKKQRAGRTEMTNTSDEDSVFNDNLSVFSDGHESTHSLGGLHEEHGDSAEDELSLDEQYEEKLRDAMDLALEKSASNRVKGLQQVEKALLKRSMGDFLEGRRETITDIIDRSLKRGKGLEQTSAANLAIIVCVQLHGDEGVFRGLEETLNKLMLDASVAPKVRAACANTLAVLAFLCLHAEEYKPVMESLEKIILTSSKAPTTTSPDVYSIYTAALSGWTLLSTMMSSRKAFDLLSKHVDHFSSLLESSNVDLRIAAGEALVILYEAIYDNEDLQDEAFDILAQYFDTLKELAKDSHKYRSKKDRKEQKSSFREILKTIEDDEEYYEKVKFSNQETLIIGSWSMKKQYELVCDSVGSGMNLYLKENQLIRDLFNLGAPRRESAAGGATKASKYERMDAFKQCHKLRQRAIGKNRGKRTAF